MEACIIKRKYTLFTLAILSILCGVLIGFYLFSLDKISNIYISKTQETVYNMKKDILKDTVNNIISEIEVRRKTKVNYLEKFMTRTAAVLKLKTELSEAEFNNFIITFFKGNPDYDFVQVILWDARENKAIYDPLNLSKGNWEDTLKEVVPEMATYRLVTHGEKITFLGISKEYSDQLVKAEVSDIIRSTRFGDNSYVWVHKIINYAGGDNFAIRIVHPNLPETEGTYLSTNIKDINGNLPYQTELQGINKNGELFFTYYFKELESDRISEKLTYAKLYKDYDWVIAMGMYLDDIQEDIDLMNQQSKTLVSRLMLVLLLVFVIILLISYCIITLIEKIRYHNTSKLMESEMNQDILTRAGNRRSGTIDINKAFKSYQKSDADPVIMMFDIDHFKGINDEHGHATGDLVLVEIVNAISGIVRSSDKIIRWGGDEFIIIFNGLQKKNALAFAQSILSVISALEISVGETVIKSTISIGISFFQKTDTESMDILKRADRALYLSKEKGRNQANLL